MQEEWIKWEPILGLYQKYQIDSLVYTEDWKMDIIVSSTHDLEKKFKFVFLDSVPASRESRKILMQEKLYFLKEKYGENFYNNWTFFKIENSNFSQWLYQQSGVYKANEFIHYALVTPQVILEIICWEHTNVKFYAL